MTANTTTAPAAVIVTRWVRHGRAAEFERLMSGMQAAAARFPGHMGGFLIPPDAPEARLLPHLVCLRQRCASEGLAPQCRAQRIAMNWIVMPTPARLIADWLYPAMREP